jgi:hypothetical protein
MPIPPLLEGLPERLEKAAQRIYSEGDPHPAGSPSSVYSCLRRQWYRATGAEETNLPSLASLKKMESGTAIEGYWHKVYEGSGFRVSRPEERLPINNEEGEWLTDGAVDGILESEEDPDFKVLLELKDLGYYSYRDVVKKGVKVGAPEYYTQVQLYMDAALTAGLTTIPLCIFHAGMADLSGSRFIWERIHKEEEGSLPNIYIEVIEQDKEWLRWAKNRIATLILLMAPDNGVPAREYDPVTLGRERVSAYPCGRIERPYCPFIERCINDGGMTIPMEVPLYV